MKRMIRFWLLGLGVLALAGCSSAPDHPLYAPSTQVYSGTGHASFEAYREATTRWIAGHRYFLGEDHAAEIAKNAPFELKPSGDEPASKGILLVHGLGDSPFSFSDLAREFAGDGFLVRTLLLAGHGTRPGDMLRVNVRDWEALVAEQVAIMKRDVGQVSLGGFSTGANLVTHYAVDDPDIAALYLFSPAFKAKSDKDFLAPLASAFKKWGFAPGPAAHNNIARYRTVPVNGVAQYYKTSVHVRDRLSEKGFDRPAFLAVSEDDSVVDVRRVLSIFAEQFTSPASRLIWYGDDPGASDARVEVVSSHIPDNRVTNYSHMALVFSPDNPWYGPGGSFRFCSNGQDHIKGAKRKCQRGDPVWYSAYGTRMPDRIHARLTWNPRFHQMMDTVRTVEAAAP